MIKYVSAFQDIFVKSLGIDEGFWEKKVDPTVKKAIKEFHNNYEFK